MKEICFISDLNDTFPKVSLFIVCSLKERQARDTGARECFFFLFPQPEAEIRLEMSQEFFFPKSWDIGEIDLNSDLEKQLDGLERPSPGSTSTRCDQKAGQDSGGSQSLPKPTDPRSVSAIKRGSSSDAVRKRLDQSEDFRRITSARH